MATSNNKQTIYSPEEVQQAINGAQQPAAGMGQTPAMQAPGAMTNPNGFSAVTPVQVGQQPQSSAWRDVQRTGNAKTDYKAILGAQPGAYRGTYQQQIGQTMNNLLTQRPFNYDVNTDALYQNIKDNYIKQGRQAMMDTQGAAAALTGGYGNSYGALAGQQAYQESLGNLSAKIPELYQLAYQRYLGNENSQRQNLAALQGLDESEYQRYQYDTQQYESRLADAYAKYKASMRSGGSGRSSMSWNEFYGTLGDIVGAAEKNGYDGHTVIDQYASVGKWTKEQTQAFHGAYDTFEKEYKRNKDAENDNVINGDG